MNDEIAIDQNIHVLYSKECEAQIKQAIALHYPSDQVDSIWYQVQKQYAAYLKNFRTDLGGKVNFHNGVAGTYDCIAMFSYYRVCKKKTSFEEIEKMNEDLILPSFEKLTFANYNRPIIQRLMHFAFTMAKKKCDRWQDYQMEVEPYKKGGPIRYAFYTCPVARFAKENDLLDILPALCNADYVAMEKLHARLVRTTTCGNGDFCDYTIYGDQDPHLANYPEYRDEQGYRTNKKKDES